MILSFFYIAVFVISLYSLMLLILLLSVRKSRLINTTDWNTKISILIAARNEERNIETCLKSILNQIYPSHLLEIIVVDDHSEDKTFELAKNTLHESKIAYQVLSLKNIGTQGKKAALEYGMSKASGELIICTDADSYASSINWISTYVNIYCNKGAQLIAAPVIYNNDKSFLAAFQQIELLILNVISAGTFNIKKPIMCNGANMAFTKKVFEEVRGYEGNRNVASGDDVFLLNKITSLHPNSVAYLFSVEALVYTQAATSIKAFIQQRLRWAGKFKYNKNKFNFFLGLLTFTTNVSWVFLIPSMLVSASLTKCLIVLLLTKCLIDFLLLFLGAIFFKRKRILMWFPLVAVIYPFYVSLSALFGAFIQIDWKGRKI